VPLPPCDRIDHFDGGAFQASDRCSFGQRNLVDSDGHGVPEWQNVFDGTDPTSPGHRADLPKRLSQFRLRELKPASDSDQFGTRRTPRTRHRPPVLTPARAQGHASSPDTSDRNLPGQGQESADDHEGHADADFERDLFTEERRGEDQT
jgi:hypothetical protein